MTISQRNKPIDFSELVFADPNVAQWLTRNMNAPSATHVLLYGPAGTGKSATCRVIAHHLLGPDHCDDLKIINVSRITTKAALCDEIDDYGGFGLFSPFGKRIILLEELDGADRLAQATLKVVIEENEEHTLFLATTNNIDEIIKPLINRFKALPLNSPSFAQWVNRAQIILRNEGIELHTKGVNDLLLSESPSTSARDILRVLDDFVLQKKQQLADLAQ